MLISKAAQIIAEITKQMMTDFALGSQALSVACRLAAAERRQDVQHRSGARYRWLTAADEAVSLAFGSAILPAPTLRTPCAVPHKNAV
jgi:hypothetical protein